MLRAAFVLAFGRRPIHHLAAHTLLTICTTAAAATSTATRAAGTRWSIAFGFRPCRSLAARGPFGGGLARHIGALGPSGLIAARFIAASIVARARVVTTAITAPRAAASAARAAITTVATLPTISPI
jgi:hypothetical protein